MDGLMNESMDRWIYIYRSIYTLNHDNTLCIYINMYRSIYTLNHDNTLCIYFHYSLDAPSTIPMWTYILLSLYIPLWASIHYDRFQHCREHSQILFSVSETVYRFFSRHYLIILQTVRTLLTIHVLSWSCCKQKKPNDPSHYPHYLVDKSKT